jgi:hypothetical protein
VKSKIVSSTSRLLASIHSLCEVKPIGTSVQLYGCCLAGYVLSKAQHGRGGTYFTRPLPDRRTARREPCFASFCSLSRASLAANFIEALLAALRRGPVPLMGDRSQCLR